MVLPSHKGAMVFQRSFSRQRSTVDAKLEHFHILFSYGSPPGISENPSFGSGNLTPRSVKIEL